MIFIKPDLNSIVDKSNELVPKLGKFDLQELRLIAYALAHLDSTKAENKIFTARVEDMAQIFSMDPDRAYGVVQKVVASMNTKPLKVVEGDEDIYIYWFSKFSYKSGTGTFTFTLTEHIRPYLLELKQRFTFYRLGDVHQFKAASTWKLYEHINQWKYTGAWHVSLNFLRHDVFGVDGKYDRFDLFRQRLIDPAVEEINTKSNLNVSYVKEREGKSVAFLRFFIQTGEKVYIQKGRVPKEHAAQAATGLRNQEGYCEKIAA
jgi:plasmid replication initiation protein